MPLFITIINFIYGWTEQNITSGLLKQGHVRLGGAGVFFQVFRVVKLGWIDENAANNFIIFLPCLLNQRQVAAVKRAHSSYKTDGFIAVAATQEIVLQLFFSSK